MPIAELANAALWYEDSGGAGQPILFMHPAAATSATWAHNLDAFVAAGWRCVTYDLRGWGRSPKAAEPGALSDDVLALADHLGLERFVLVAAAYGGFGALDTALLAPERLRALVLSGTQGGLTDPEYQAMLQRAVEPAIRDLPAHLREVGPSYRARSPEGVQRWIAIEHSAGPLPRPRQQLRQQISLAMLSDLRVPTLLVAGGADLLAPPALMALLAERLAHSTFVTLGEAGHSIHWELPDEWNRVVLDFLSRV